MKLEHNMFLYWKLFTIFVSSYVHICSINHDLYLTSFPKTLILHANIAVSILNLKRCTSVFTKLTMKRSDKSGYIPHSSKELGKTDS